MPRPKKFYDENGLCRVTLKKGSARQPGGASPHAQYVQDDGKRVNAYGLPVERTAVYAYPPIVWDLEDDPEDLGEGATEDAEAAAETGELVALDFAEVAELAMKSPSLLASLGELDARGFALDEGPRGEGHQSLVGAGRILIDPELAAKTSVTASVAREAARVLAVQAKCGARGRDRAEFVSRNAEASVREEGEAVLAAFQVREEILAAAGPDIGVPGADQAALELCAAVRAGQAPRAVAALEIGRSALAPTIADAQAHYERLWARVFDVLSGGHAA
ncbi:MAG: hypothetical protein IPG50_08865 [Myxococcales bacterium]|nr:hypothetical protein [Myxococcales bacterium]